MFPVRLRRIRRWQYLKQYMLNHLPECAAPWKATVYNKRFEYTEYMLIPNHKNFNTYGTEWFVIFDTAFGVCRNHFKSRKPKTSRGHKSVRALSVRLGTTQTTITYYKSKRAFSFLLVGNILPLIFQTVNPNVSLGFVDILLR